LHNLLYALAAYGAVVALMYGMQRSLMYFPDRSTPDPGDAGVPEMQQVPLHTADGLELVAWYRPASEGRSTIVYFHGNGGNIGGRGYKVKPYLAAGYGVMLVEYRGYGGNPSSPDEAGLYADGRAALAWLDASGVPPERTVLYGESLGSGVAVQLAFERPPAALVLEAPFTSASDVAAASYWFLPVRLLIKDRFDSIAKIGDVEAPLLLVHGERDRVVPVRFGRRLFDSANEPKQAVFLPAGHHNDLADHGLMPAVLTFLEGLSTDHSGRQEQGEEGHP
jgi:fermentation-respiration switch protein FrsA (DUF1100 family)